ncbi:TPM domain-containing protein [Paenibacillus sp. MWE-103]|uniref:TPM domain-containing protein n=1 Tax=Paenibacillus artemisiicola TaxID=1172618 RepID=A0ABS3W8Z3_9BACL|nr:TPM domain-containing protein [Paenibacillus artemisiicola]MBO7744781.1 TPM domain-containing protein [Paenibacillus artemisiicola]
MTRKIALIALFLFALFASLASAAPLPAKGKGHVYDGGGMFPSGRLQGLEQAAAAGAPYAYYIVTLESLGASEPDAYAEALYDAWKLRADDVLILLAKQERRVQLYFVNPPLQRKLDALPDDYAGNDYAGRAAIDRFVGGTFTPLAKEGDYAGGVLKLIAAAKQLPEPAGDAAPGAEPDTAPDAGGSPSSGETATPPATPPDSGIAAGNGTAAGQPSSPANRTGLAIALLVLALVAAAAIMLVLYLIRRSRHARLVRETDAIAVELFRAQELLRPLVGLYSGPATAATLKPVADALDARAASAQELLRTLGGSRPGFFSGGGRRATDAAGATAARLRADAGELRKQAEHLVELDRQNGREVSGIQGELSGLAAKAGELATANGLSLARIKQEIAENAEQVEVIRKRQVTDLIDAAELLKPHRATVELHASLLERLPSFLSQRQLLPDDIAQARSRIEGELRAERLELTEFNPFDRLEEASRRLAPFADALAAGDLREAAGQSEAMTGAIAEAQRMVRERVALRDGLAADLETLERFAGSFSFGEAAYREELGKLRSQFDESVWGFMPDAFRAATDAFRELEAGLAPLREAFGEQRYAAARPQADRLLELSKRAAEAAESCLKARERAHARTEALRAKWEDARQTFEAAASQAAAHRLPAAGDSGARVATQEDAIQAELRETDRLLSPPGIHPDAAELRLNQLASRVAAYAQDVQRLVQEKQTAERRMRELGSRYDSVHARTRHRSLPGHFDASYQARVNEADRMFALGMYAGAIEQMNEADRQLQRMQSAYDDILREERRHEEERRRHEELHRQNSAHHGGHQGGGHHGGSTGGDSFDKPRGSSGGDNW